MTLTIYGVYRSRASRNIWLCNEMGLAFSHVPVIQAYRLPDGGKGHTGMTTQSPEFLSLNPSGQIPSIDDDGLVLNESLGINLYLAKKYGGALGPKDAAEDALMTQWALWAATSCEPHTIEILYNRVGKPVEERDPAKADAAVAVLKRYFAVLDAHLAKTGFMVGGRFTVADINVAEVFRYARPAPELFADAPHVDKWLSACHARPAFTAMMAARDAEPA
ncbi:MAG: glutathione S-transferase family protein [Bosea sp. (in: a-proteobacteria)]